jgi:hypothetical protein
MNSTGLLRWDCVDFELIHLKKYSEYMNRYPLQFYFEKPIEGRSFGQQYLSVFLISKILIKIK